MTERKQIVEAVNYLVASSAYSSLIGEITKIIETWDTHPMVYAGQLAHLNALVDVGLANREAFERLVQLIEAKRREVPVTKRQDYQRGLMRERRARQAKAVELREATHGRMTSDQRKAYAAKVQADWMAERAAFLQSRAPKTWADRNAAARAFWATVDARLDAELKKARSGRGRPRGAPTPSPTPTPTAAVH